MALVKRREVLSPSPENKVRVDRRVKLAMPIFRAALFPWHQITVSGRENVPRTGPVLVLSNHVASLDPITLILASGRQIHFMATRSLMNEPGISRVMQLAAVVPRSKFVTDTSSVRTLKAWRDLDAAVGLFPEGERTWDGRGLPLVRGIEKLVRLMRAPVVTARIINAYRQAPRWGAQMRHGRVHVEFDPPREFDRKARAADVRAYIEERIRVEPGHGEDWRVWGRQLADGAENVLFACPRCFALDALVPSGSTLTCRSCQSSWTVDTHNRLHGGGEALSLIDAMERIHERYEGEWIADRGRYESEGVLLESEPMTLLDLTTDELTPITRGQLRLTTETLSVVNGEDPWEVPLGEVHIATVDLRRRLQFQTGRGPVEAVLPSESVLKWVRWVEHWRGKIGS
jgi:1-acyl-sn-glycerol-3-phosphate acyltransferase